MPDSILDRLRDLPLRQRCLLAVCVTLASAAIVMPQLRMTPGAWFGGDTWEYQSMAVNFAAGQGFHRSGPMLEDINAYHFDYVAADQANWDATMDLFYANKGAFNSFRTPGFPTALGLLYKVVGVNPLIAKWCQFALIVATALLLPLIGALWWPRGGYWMGLIAVPPFIWTNFKFATELLSEPMILAAVAVWLLAAALYSRRPGWQTAAIWGAVTTLGLLVKGSLIFFPLMAGLYLVWRWWRDRRRAVLLHVVAYSVAFWVVMLPWSVHLSRQIGKVSVLSNQGDIMLYDNHNEYCGDGEWHPEWRTDPNSFFNNDGMADRPAWQRVLNFYRHHPDRLTDNLKNVTISYPSHGFLGLAFLGVAVLALQALAGDRLRQPGPARGLATAGAIAIMAFGLWAAAHAHIPARNPYDTFFICSYIAGFVLGAIAWRRLGLQIPLPIVFVIVNFVIIVAMTSTPDTPYYRARYTKVGDAAHLLLAGYILTTLALRLRALWPDSQDASTDAEGEASEDDAEPAD